MLFFIWNKVFYKHVEYLCVWSAFCLAEPLVQEVSVRLIAAALCKALLSF
jgi:hypothetical protein